MKISISFSLLLFTRFILIHGERSSVETYFESTNHPDNYPNNHSEVKSYTHTIMSESYI